MRHVPAGLYMYYGIGIFSVILISILAFYIAIYRKLKLPRWIFHLLIVLSMYMFFLQLLKYYSLHFYTDFAHWAQVIYSISTVGKPLCLANEIFFPGTLNFFSIHFTPLVYLIAFVYKIFPYAETIIILNNLLMISAIIPLYKLCYKENNDKSFALFVCVLLLWYPSFQYIVMYEFDMLRFSIPIIFWMLYFFEKENMRAYYFFAILAVFVREEVGLTIMMFGLYVFFFKNQRLTGLVTTLIGLSIFIILIQKVMPSLLGPEYNENYSLTIIYGVFGNTNMEIIKNIIFNPILTISIIFNKIKLMNVFMMFLPLLFISFLAPSILFSSLAAFGIVLLSTLSEAHSSYMLYYISPTIPFIFYAFIKGWPKMLKIVANFVDKKNRVTDFSHETIIAVLSGVLISNVFFGPSPLSLQFWSKELRPAPFKTQDFHYSVYKVTDHHRKAKEFSRLIPDTSIVAAHDYLQPLLNNKRGFMLLNQHSKSKIFIPDYILFDKTNNNLKPISPAFKTQDDFGMFENNKYTWRLLRADDGFFLYKRKS